jgi:magnesium-transporting ATPase (P-type)
MLLIGRTTITALQILIINVVYDGIPGFFLAFEMPEPGVMARKPIPKGSGVFAQNVGVFIAARAITFSVLTLTAFFIGAYIRVIPAFPGDVLYIPWDGTWSISALRYGGNFGIGSTMAFMVLSWASTIDTFNTRTQQSIFKAGFLSNKGVLFAVVGALIFSCIVALWTPLANIFDVVPVSGRHWAIMAGLAVMQLGAVEILKLVLRRCDRKK